MNSASLRHGLQVLHWTKPVRRQGRHTGDDQKLPYIDMHCDTLMGFAENESFSLLENQASVDFARLQKGDAAAQFFAMFFPQWRDPAPMTDDEYLHRLHTGLQRAVEAASDRIAMAYTAADLERNLASGKLSAILTVEDARWVQNDLSRLDRLYEMGVRAIALLWNHENCMGYPNSTDPAVMQRGLKAFGIQSVERMNELGILIDVSHLSEGGFWDVAKYSKKPFIASHSNARALSPHQRNLSDEQLRALGQAGGVTGINFCPAFLHADPSCNRSTVERMVAHAAHIVNVAGLEACGLGSDLDGIGGELEIGSCDRMSLLWDALQAAGFSEDAVEQIAYRNVLRVMRDAL